MTALFPIPPSWAWTTLGEIAEVVGGVTKDTKKQSDPCLPEVPYLRVANVQRGYLDLREITKIRVPESTLAKLSLLPGDVLLNEGGDRDKLGRGWVWDGQIPNCIHQNHVFRARLREGTVLPRFLALYANDPARQWFERHAAQSVNLASISLSMIKQLPVPLPPLDEQHRIVATLEDHLSRLDIGVRNLLVADNRVSRLWQSALDRVTAAKLAHVALVGEVAEVQGGIQKQPKRKPVKDKYPFLRVANVLRGNLDLAEIHDVELFEGELDRYRLRMGDLLVVEGNGSPEQIGRAAMWRDEIKDCVHQNHLIRVRPGAELDPCYLELVWNAPVTAEQLRRVASSTSGLHTLSTAKVKSIQIPVPPRRVQEVLAEEAFRTRSEIEIARNAVRQARKRAAALRQSLLMEAFRGKLVAQDPVDVAAVVLLERRRRKQTTQSKTRRGRRRANCEPPEETLL